MPDLIPFTEIETLAILKEKKIQNIKNNKFPFFLLRMELYHEYGKAKIRPALVRLVQTKKIKMGDTATDFYLDVAISGRYREIEDKFLTRHNFKTF